MGLISDQGNPHDARRPDSGGARRNYKRGYGPARYTGYGDGQPGFDGGPRDGYQGAGYGAGRPGFDGGYRDGYAGERQGAGRHSFREVEGFRHGGGVRRRPVAGRRGRYRRRAGGTRVPLVAVVAMVASVAVVAAGVAASRILTANNAAGAAPAVNMNCTLIVPASPLSAQGLATPYQLTATDPAAGPCNEANPNQTAFVQGAVLDPATGQISVYDPLVIDAGTQPAAAPVVPTLPDGGIVAVWFGFNGNTLSLAGPDQVTVTPSTAAATPASATSPPATAAPSATVSGSPTATPAASGTPAATASPTGSTSPTASASSSQSAAPPTTATVPATPPATATVPASTAALGGAANAAVEAEGSAPLSPNSSANAQYTATLTQVSSPGAHHHRMSATSSPSPSASVSTTGSASAATATPGSMNAPAASSTPSASASATATATAVPTVSSPPAAAGDTPAASGAPDAILQQANCVAGESIGGQFSSFTQVGACNAVAFFAAANAAIVARKLRVPSPGIASDGMKCLTTRSFALIDQDQSDNVTTEYLAEGDGQTAQDTAADRQAIAGSSVLFNGSDNGLLDLFVDPALGCTPWEVPNLADGGAPAPALPLDEIQASRYAGGRGNPAALVPLNDPMTLDGNGQFSTDKTNTYRSLVDMLPLPSGESPSTYCKDMERIQGARLQQDVNLLTQNPGPAPGAANNLFTFMAMRLQQSFVNLNCGSFGLQNDVTTTLDGNGIVVAACFLNQVAAVTSGPGNPMAGTTVCPATAASSSSPGATSPATTTASPAASNPAASNPAASSPSPSSTATASAWRRHHGWHHHWWW